MLSCEGHTNFSKTSFSRLGGTVYESDNTESSTEFGRGTESTNVLGKLIARKRSTLPVHKYMSELSREPYPHRHSAVVGSMSFIKFHSSLIFGSWISWGLKLSP